MTNHGHTCSLPTPIPMTIIVTRSQISFPLILDKATESSQNNCPENELTPELTLTCPWWSTAHLSGKPPERASTSCDHEDKATEALTWLHLGICLCQSQGYSLISLGTGSDSCLGCLESNQQPLTSKLTEPARPPFWLEPYIGCFCCSEGRPVSGLL